MENLLHGLGVQVGESERGQTAFSMLISGDPDHQRPMPVYLLFGYGPASSLRPLNQKLTVIPDDFRDGINDGLH
ncbi:hypothetical protein SDC9_128555 [bioreactor metagenome]|uniref:Uncharacterized protein n=1 Tax=bioreactor metagenome TaxID=1076179 RepID=A0A645CXT1_9ZZZZ